MLLDVDIEAARKMLGSAQRLLNVALVPDDQDSSNPGPYRPEYAWMYRFERKLARLVDTYDPHLRHVLFGVSGPFSEAMSNAYCHGNRRDGSQAIWITADCSARGLLITVQDDGAGFDVQGTVQQLRRGSRYWYNAGLGLSRLAAHETLGACFDCGGRRIGLLHLRSGLGEVPAQLIRAPRAGAQP